jgi:hypothetical protein
LARRRFAPPVALRRTRGGNSIHSGAVARLTRAIWFGSVCSKRNARERDEQAHHECDGGDHPDADAEHACGVGVVRKDVQVEDREHGERDRDRDERDRDRDRDHVVERRENHETDDAHAVPAREQIGRVTHGSAASGRP